jgi:hypothetical protein
MPKKMRHGEYAGEPEVQQRSDAKAVAAIVAPANTGLDLDRTTLVIPRHLRREVEQRLLDIGRRVSFSGIVEAALREVLAGDTEAIIDRWDARARRVGS